MKRASAHRKLGEILVKAGLIDEKILEEAIETQKKNHKGIGQVLVEMGILTEIDIAKGLAEQFNLPFCLPDELVISKDVLSLIPFEFGMKYGVIPLQKEKNGLLVAIANPLQQHVLDDLRFKINMPVYPAVAPLKSILAALGKHHPKIKALKMLEVKEAPSEPTLAEGDSKIEIIRQVKSPEKRTVDLMDIAGKPPVVQFVNSLFTKAVNMKASDIHLEPQKDSVAARFRIDGLMHEIMKYKKEVHPSVVSRIKVISNMDISVQRKPQDGKAQVRYKDKTFDLRVSSLPSFYGEKVTIRVLDPDMAKLTPEEIGFSERDYQVFMDAIAKPEGMILVTGPTGSGKSSTLYACLNKLNTPDVNIVTVEDPIEFDIKGITQVGVNPKAGITFADSLRSILRQDPDIIMIGEIRDSETAAIAFRAAQTGHLVFSTLHTNDAPSAIIRLMDLGVQPFVIAASLIAVVSQRLVRKICPKCKVPAPASSVMMKRLSPYIDVRDPMFWKGEGCQVCQNTGYKGRIGIFEVLGITSEIKSVITSEGSAAAILKAAHQEGFRGLTSDGLAKAVQGITSLEEVLQAAPLEMASKAGNPDPSEPKPQKPARSIPKILVAEDNELTLSHLLTALASERYEVLKAMDGNEAFNLAVNEIPDVILTDYMMPGMDGLSLIRELRKHPDTTEIPIIMLTARDELESELETLDAGANDYLTKPINAKRLLARIKRILKEHR